jgi:hypothetical protein
MICFDDFIAGAVRSDTPEAPIVEGAKLIVIYC